MWAINTFRISVFDDKKKPTGRFGNGRVFTDMVGRISHSFYGLLIFIFTEKINVFYLFLFSYLILYIENTLWRKLYFHVVKSSDIAQELGVKRVVPAYRRLRRIKPDDLKTGVCFASGGSGIDHLTSRTLGVLSTGDQIGDFKKYLKKLKNATKNKKEMKKIISNAVFLISEGNNDIGYFVTPARLRLRSIDTYTSDMVFWTKAFLQDLYDLGARKFAVMGVIPVGCLPFHRFLFGGVFAWCNFMMNRISEDFNTKLQKALIGYEVEKSFKGAKFVYVDMYGSIMDLINHPKAYGFTEAKRSCCCMVTSIIPCRNPDEYVFYDFAHPTMKTYEVISKPLVYQMRKGLA
ncbi:BnaC02g23340D [Brassica napus]|uniref:BnaC02g23340D protein n=1 Tax=Brassica napus TaxID=3708 RepID=A0A078FMI4_BRANA|nr:BnaC02g23340D [Brassica napus]